MLVGCARCSTDQQDLTAQCDALTALGVNPNRIYVDLGLTGTNRARPGLRDALAGCRSGDTLVVTKLDRLARSLTDARHIVDELTEADVKLNIGGSVHDPTDPVAYCRRATVGFSVNARNDAAVTRAVATIPDDAWQPIPSPGSGGGIASCARILSERGRRRRGMFALPRVRSWP
jgi:hypothetical protein